MSRQSSRFERAGDLERMLHELEQKLARLSRIASRSTSEAPDTAARVGDMIAAALGDIADRFRGRARSFGGDVSQMSDEALRFGNDALRKLSREVDHKPLVILAVAVGVGALAAGLLARRG
jgi:hypothetical protein